jgi:hypothetical protein
MKIPHADVYFLPEYSHIYQRHGDGEALCFVLESEDGLVLYPFLLRPVHADGSADLVGKRLLDISTPYGYGGPLVSPAAAGDAKELVRVFRDSFHAYCVREGIVSEFARLHPLLRNHELLSPETLVRHHETVYVDLTRDEASLWGDIRKGHKSSIKKAQREQVVVKAGSDDDALSGFFALYTETMQRQDASPWYFLSKSFFSDTIRLLGSHVALFTAWHGGRTTNAALFLRGGDFAHYHFAGAAADSMDLGGNHLLIWEAMKWAREAGARYLHLGGGLSADDLLFRFKSGFSSSRSLFYTQRVIHDDRAYDQLVDENARRTLAEDARVDASYFPRYRA